MKLEYRSPVSLHHTLIPRAERIYAAKYLGPWCIKDARGNWTERPIDVFYTANPSKPEYSHYFGFYRDFIAYNLIVCDAASFNSVPLTGMLVDDVLYVSRYRHDCIEVNGSVIDGGRDYIHTNSTELVQFNFVDGEICLI